MGFIMNSSSGVAQNSEGSATVPKDLKVEGKFAANGATPVGKATTVSTLSTTLSLALLTEVVTALNSTNKVVNEQATILKNAGLMS